jgi:energy-coupling factor transport system substrate-specific component
MNLHLRRIKESSETQKNSISVKDIIIIGMMSAVLVTVQVALSFLPNIELVSLLIIIFTLVFRWRALFIIYVFIFVEGLIFGFGQWWFSWLYIWPILFLIAMLFNKIHSFIVWAIISCVFGLVFGALNALPVIIISGMYAGFAYWIQGIIFDVVHGIGNFVTALLLFHPLYYLINKINKQFYS